MDFFDEYAYNEYSSSKNPFAAASLVLGGIAIVTFSSIVPAIFTGSLSIIFAMLSRKGTNRLHPSAKIGAICSAISLALGISIFVLYLNYMPTFLQNEAYRTELKYMLESVYGTEFDADSFLNDFESGNLFSQPEDH